MIKIPPYTRVLIRLSMLLPCIRRKKGSQDQQHLCAFVFPFLGSITRITAPAICFPAHSSLFQPAKSVPRPAIRRRVSRKSTLRCVWSSRAPGKSLDSCSTSSSAAEVQCDRLTAVRGTSICSSIQQILQRPTA